MLATSCLKSDSSHTAGVTQDWVGTVTLNQTSSYVDAFATNTGSQEIASNVLTYQNDSNTPFTMRDRLSDQNDRMADMGFGDFSRSNVHESSSGIIFYAAYSGTNASNGTSRDMCMACFDPNSFSDEPICIVEGPTTAGIGLASENLEGSGFTPEEVDHVLVPLRPVQQGFGNFSQGVSPERYQTAGGNVEIRYNAMPGQQGTIIFTATGTMPDGKRDYALSGEWTVNY